MARRELRARAADSRSKRLRAAQPAATAGEQSRHGRRQEGWRRPLRRSKGDVVRLALGPPDWLDLARRGRPVVDVQVRRLLLRADEAQLRGDPAALYVL